MYTEYYKNIDLLKIDEQDYLQVKRKFTLYVDGSLRPGCAFIFLQ